MMPLKKINGHNGHNGHSHATPNGAGSASHQLEENPGKTRYSDEELEEFRQIILVKLERAQNELIFLEEAISGNPHGTDDTSRKMRKDEISNEVNDQQAVRQKKLINNLQAALVRIENKSYGISVVTGKLISKIRLRIVPHATMEAEVKNMQRNEEKKQKVVSNQPWLKH